MLYLSKKIFKKILTINSTNNYGNLPMKSSLLFLQLKKKKQRISSSSTLDFLPGWLGDLSVIHWVSGEGGGVQGEVEKGEKAFKVMEGRWRKWINLFGRDAGQAAPLGGDSFSSSYNDFNIASLFSLHQCHCLMWMKQGRSLWLTHFHIKQPGTIFFFNWKLMGNLFVEHTKGL